MSEIKKNHHVTAKFGIPDGGACCGAAPPFHGGTSCRV